MTRRIAAGGIHLSGQLLCVLLLAASAIRTAKAEVREDLSYSYYTVSSIPGQPLYAAIDAVSPVRENGKVFHGHTGWNVAWNFRWWQEPDGRCRITSASVTLRSVIRLPLLRADSAPRQRVFDSYLEALRQHELGHHQIGMDAARAVEQDILAQPEMRQCKLLEQTINQRGAEIVARFNARNKTYDQHTEHGKTQGAWLTE